MLDRYEKKPVARLEKKIEKFLAGKNGAGVYQVIYRKVCEASSEYPRRDYGKEMNEKIKRQRIGHDSYALEGRRDLPDNIPAFAEEPCR